MHFKEYLILYYIECHKEITLIKMKTQIKILKKRLEQYTKPLEGKCRLLPLVIESLELMLDLDLDDNQIKRWIVDNRNALIIIEDHIKELLETNPQLK